MAGKKARAARKPRLSKPAAKAVRKIVKAEISRETEDKMASILTTKLHNSGIGGSGDCYQLIPTLAQGVDSHQRLGDSVRPKRLKVQFQISLDTAEYTNNTHLLAPIQARVLILKQKTIKNWGSMGTFDNAHLLRTNEGGSSAERAYTGDQFDNLRMINTDLFEVLMDKKLTFKPQYVNPPIPGSGSDGIDYPVLPNTFVFTKYVKLPKKLTYDDGNANMPNNACPFATIGYCYPIGIAPDVATTQVQCSVFSTLYYEDA